VVGQRSGVIVCCLGNYLVDRRLSPALSACRRRVDPGPRTHRRACFRSCLASSLVVVAYWSQSTFSSSNTTYNTIVTCKLPHRAQRRPARSPRCSSSPPFAPHHSLLVSVYQLVYTHSFAPSASDDPTMNRNLVQDGASPSLLSIRVLFAALVPHSVSQSLLLSIVIHSIFLEFLEENWDDDFEFGSPSARNSPVQSTRRRSIPSPPHSPPRVHKHTHTRSRGNGINNLSLTTSTRTTRWSADPGLDDENWDEDEPTIPPVVQSQSVVSCEQMSTKCFVGVSGPWLEACTMTFFQVWHVVSVRARTYTSPPVDGFHSAK
jgi:hypothetical protein